MQDIIALDATPLTDEEERVLAIVALRAWKSTRDIGPPPVLVSLHRKGRVERWRNLWRRL